MAPDNMAYRLHRAVAEHLENKEVKLALDEIDSCIHGIPEWKLHESYNNIVTIYRYMLQYYRKNMNDDKRAALYNDIIRKLYVLNDEIFLAINRLISSEYYFLCLKEQDRKEQTLYKYLYKLETFTEDLSIAELLHQGKQQKKMMYEIRLNHERTNTELFKMIWVSQEWNADTQRIARRLIESSIIPVNDKALFVSAVTLGGLHIFDLKKYLFLLDAYDISDDRIGQRALTGIILLSLRHSKRIETEPEIKARLSILNENEEFRRNMTEIQIQLLRTRETEKIGKKMSEEIIPEVIKQADRLRRSKKSELENEAPSEEEANPDWEKPEDTEKISDKIQELGDMQLEGFDVYMGTFSQLKRFSFFDDISNWFYPFDANHTEVAKCLTEDEDKKSLLLRNLLYNSPICNSDKYSFCFCLKRIPAEQRKFYEKGMGENEMEELSSSEFNPENRPLQREEISQQYIQDLYRFFKVYPKRQEFFDVFSMSLNLLHCPVLKDSINSTEQQIQITEYLFRKGYYKEAAAQFRLLLQQGKDSAKIYQKLGFCCQKEKDYPNALEAYIQADIRQPDNVWTDRHIGQCYRMSGEHEKAIAYFEKVKAAEPEDLSLLLAMGQCHAELKRYDEALALFFEVEYFAPKSIKAQRAIAWYSFLANKMEQAKKYYEKLLQSSNPQDSDYLNAGHVAWCMKNPGKAVQLYIKGSRKHKNPETFIELLIQDKDVLIRHGIPENDIPLMTDLIRYQGL